MRLLKRYPIAAFLILTFVCSWATVLIVAFSLQQEAESPSSFFLLIFPGQFMPSIIAVIMVSLLLGKSGLKKIWTSISRWKIDRFGWFLIAADLIAFSFAILMYSILYPQGLSWQDVELKAIISNLIVAFILGMIFGGLSEEIGWRFYLLDRLLSKHSIFVSSIIVTLIWSLWHLEPDFVVLALEGNYIQFWQNWANYMGKFMIETLPLSFIMTLLWIHSKKSLFAMFVIHSFTNAVISSIPVSWKPLPTILLFTYYLCFCLLALWFYFIFRARNKDIHTPDESMD